jgi:hypothetical protein
MVPAHCCRCLARLFKVSNEIVLPFRDHGGYLCLICKTRPGLASQYQMQALMRCTKSCRHIVTPSVIPSYQNVRSSVCTRGWEESSEEEPR